MRTVIGITAFVVALAALQHGMFPAALLCIAVAVIAGRQAKRAATGHAHAGNVPLSARHEAGHMAAARHVGGTVTSARLNPDGSGWVDARVPDDPKARITFYLAGAEAAGTNRGAERDFDDVNRALTEIPADDRSRVLKAARADARRAVSSRSGEIRRDAARLQERGRL